MNMDLGWWIATIGVPLVGGLLGADIYIHRAATAMTSKVDAAVARVSSEKDQEIRLLHERVSSINKEFTDYRVNSAMLFATVTAVRDVKQELVSALKEVREDLAGAMARIDDKLDRIVDRNERRDHAPQRGV